MARLGKSLKQVKDGCPLDRGSSDANFTGPATEIFAISRKINYGYSERVHDVTTRCCLYQTRTTGWHRLRSGSVRVFPAPVQIRYFDDPFGNRMIEIKHQEIESRLAIMLMLEVEGGQKLKLQENGAYLDSPQRFAEPTPLTIADASLDQALRELLSSRGRRSVKPAGVANELCAFVHQRMRYRSGATEITTPASNAWALREGVCQDYSHVMLALCRRAGIPARYVAGYVLGQPGPIAMHAWVEVYGGCKDGLDSPVHSNESWLGFDPTRGKIAGSKYLATAMGRDYSDVKPISGQFRGEGKAVLRTSTRIDRKPS